jgi:hypothetical protein
MTTLTARPIAVRSVPPVRRRRTLAGGPPARLGSGGVLPTGRGDSAGTGRIREPDGLERWRAAVAASPRRARPTVAQCRAVLAVIRSNGSLGDAAEASGLDVGSLLDVVIGVGTRLSQGAVGSCPVVAKAFACTGPAARSLGGPGLYPGPGSTVIVILGSGWDRGATHLRSVNRAYASVAVSDGGRDDWAIDRWRSTTDVEQVLTYGHFAHLYAVATGVMATLTGISEDREVQAAYVRAFDMMADTVAASGAAVTRLCQSRTPAEVLQSLPACFWSLERAAGVLHRCAGAAASGDLEAAVKLSQLVAGVRSGVTRTPARFFPRSLADLTHAQFRAITAVLGHRVQDSVEGTAHVDAGLESFTAALLAGRSGPGAM